MMGVRCASGTSQSVSMLLMVLLCVWDYFGTDSNWLRIAPISFAETF